MTCPICFEATEVIKTTPVQTGGRDLLRQCPAHGRFWASERLARWVPVSGEGPSTEVTGNLDAPSKVTGNRTGNVTGNFKAISSDSGQISLIRNSDPDQASSKPQSQTRRRVEYPKAFLIEWELTAKTGSKDKALAAWNKNGRDAFGLSWKAWERSAQWQQEWFNYPNVSTWLNDGRWKQDPGEAKLKTPTPPAGIPHVKPWIAAERAEEERRSKQRFDAATARDQVQQELARDRERLKAGGSL